MLEEYVKEFEQYLTQKRWQYLRGSSLWIDPQNSAIALPVGEAVEVQKERDALAVAAKPLGVYAQIQAEREKQDAKWGEQNWEDFEWLAILTEEVGELAQALLHDKHGGKAAGTKRTELVHVVAVGVQWLECLERRRIADEERARQQQSHYPV